MWACVASPYSFDTRNLGKVPLLGDPLVFFQLFFHVRQDLIPHQSDSETVDSIDAPDVLDVLDVLLDPNN